MASPFGALSPSLRCAASTCLPRASWPAFLDLAAVSPRKLPWHATRARRHWRHPPLIGSGTD